jgi:predicted aminopeptidase
MTASVGIYRVETVENERIVRRLLRASLALLISASLGGCAAVSLDVGYYWQSITGHLAVMRAGRPIPELLAEPDLDAKLRGKLELVREIRQFASRELGLPENSSYTRYADLKRPFVLWNIFATPELSMNLVNWCFPIAGCVSYRGYYEKEDADRFAEQLRQEGFDVYVGGVPAYSTLGWFDDPVLSTFIQYPDGELARLIFHELAHQVLYVQGDSRFNESFATAVEEAGLKRWLALRQDHQQEGAYRTHAQRKQQFIDLLKKHRTELQRVFAQTVPDQDKRRGKAAVFDALQSDYQDLKRSWGGWAGYDRWFGQKLGNPHLASVATYTDAVPGFRRLLAAQGDDLPKFFDAARALADQAKVQRDLQLGVTAP